MNRVSCASDLGGAVVVVVVVVVEVVLLDGLAELDELVFEEGGVLVFAGAVTVSPSPKPIRKQIRIPQHES